MRHGFEISRSEAIVASNKGRGSEGRGKYSRDTHTVGREQADLKLRREN